MRDTLPALFSASSDLLFHITTMLSPKVLLDHKVKVVHLNQRAGEFVITFPRGYHAGFNQGFNCAEAVNLAMPDWLQFGLRCVELYSKVNKQPVFSHDQLVLATAKSDIPTQNAIAILDSMKLLIEREARQRDQALLFFPDIEHEKQPPLEDGDPCCVCKSFCYLSALTTINGMYCLSHASHCTSKPKLIIRFTLSELIIFAENYTSQQAAVPLKWGLDVGIMIGSRPSIFDMQMHLNRAYGFEHPQKSKLVNHIIDCQNLVSDAIVLLPRRGGTAKHTIFQMESVLEKWVNLSFNSTELDQLYARYNLSKQLFRQVDLSIKEHRQVNIIKKLVNECNVLQIQITNENSIILYIAQCEWQMEVASTVNLRLEDYTRLIEQAAKLGFSEHPLLEPLIESHNQLSAWVTSCEKSLESPHLYRELVRHLVNSFPNDPRLMDQLKNLILNTEVWNTMTSPIKSRCQYMEVRLKPQISVDNITWLVNTPVAIDPNIVYQIKEWMEPVLAWNSSLNKVFGFKEALKQILLRTQRLDTSNLMHCVCHRLANSQMVFLNLFKISCRVCLEWYHIACVGSGGPDFVCPVCDEPRGISMGRLSSLEDSAQKLIVSTPESLILSDLFHVLDEYRNEMNASGRYGYFCRCMHSIGVLL